MNITNLGETVTRPCQDMQGDEWKVSTVDTAINHGLDYSWGHLMVSGSIMCHSIISLHSSV